MGTERIRQQWQMRSNSWHWPVALTSTWAVGQTAAPGRFATGDLDSILTANGLNLTRRCTGGTALAQRACGRNVLGANITDGPSRALLSRGRGVDHRDDPHDVTVVESPQNIGIYVMHQMCLGA